WSGHLLTSLAVMLQHVEDKRQLYISMCVTIAMREIILTHSISLIGWAHHVKTVQIIVKMDCALTPAFTMMNTTTVRNK
ncbi:hypothetical protein HispidOSU_003804, partial [Sigmodon hispidus]